jgi:hypothetical protein
MRRMFYALAFTSLIFGNTMAAQMTVGDLMKLCTSSNRSEKASCFASRKTSPCAYRKVLAPLKFEHLTQRLRRAALQNLLRFPDPVV